eukprot:SAG25_NODE_1404_length_3105_cov_2.112442_2_plen_84_part_00
MQLVAQPQLASFFAPVAVARPVKVCLPKLWRCPIQRHWIRSIRAREVMQAQLYQVATAAASPSPQLCTRGGHITKQLRGLCVR